MRDAMRRVYICAVTPEHVQFIGPFGSQQLASIWGIRHLDNPSWNLVSLFPHDLTTPLELVTP